MGRFQHALELMGSNDALGPLSWTDYLRGHGDSGAPKTAHHLSVQHLGGLDTDLKEAGTMVIRLGKGTFGLVRPPQLTDFFLTELDSGNAELFFPESKPEELFPFRLMGAGIEANGVNLALASGAFNAALDLPNKTPRNAPALGKSTYDFKVRPHRELPDLCWQHSGQVEIDALVLGQRLGRWTLFVIEAKSGSGIELAKYKLAYACEALRGHPLLKGSDVEIEIVPVYLRSEPTQNGVRLSFTECSYGSTTGNNNFIADLTPVHTRVLAIQLN